MADPICRWRNPYYHTVRELINALPDSVIDSKTGRAETNTKWGSEFFGTPYQTACQLGLYFEENGKMTPRFDNSVTVKQIYIYLRNWVINYSVPNPYTNGFNDIEPKSVHKSLCDILITKKSQTSWSDAILDVFGEKIGNDDILKNTINTYSDYIIIKGDNLNLKKGITYEDLSSINYSNATRDRNSKSEFFNLFMRFNTTKTYVGETENKIFYGAPGTGKSHKVNLITKSLDNHFWERITFHPEFDYSSFIGGYKPVSDKVKTSKDGEDDKFVDEIKYQFTPQAFTNLYIRAWQETEENNQYFLVIEEINRGNCAEIFGDIFQLLDRKSNYTVSPSKELKDYLIDKLGKEHDGIINGLKLPNNLNILATMNTSDQSLFPMDSAFKRRWDWEYIPVNYEKIYIDDNGTSKVNESFVYEIVTKDEKKIFNWIDFIKTVNQIIKHNENLGMDKCIGNFFVKPNNDKSITIDVFINKVIFYLWNDVFKDEEDSENIFPKGIFYEDFFPINKNGLETLNKVIKQTNKIAELNNFDNIKMEE